MRPRSPTGPPPARGPSLPASSGRWSGVIPAHRRERDTTGHPGGLALKIKPQNPKKKKKNKGKKHRERQEQRRLGRR